MTKRSWLGLWCILLTFNVTFPVSSYGLTAPNPNTQRTSAASTQPQVAPRITQAIDASQVVVLTGNTRPEANAVSDRGAVADTLPIDHILIFLQRSAQQEQAVDKLISQLNNKKSPNFHQWMSAEQFGEQFGVAEQDIQTITGWLESNGFTINQVYPNRMVIDISGTAGEVAQAFHTQIHNLEVNGANHIANISDPQIPAALAPVIKGIFSLNDFQPHHMYKPVSQYTFAGCTTSATVPTEPGTCYAVTPQDNQTIYNLTPLYNAGISGQGQTIVLIEDTDVYNFPGDWNTYRTTFGLSGYAQGNFTQVHPGGCSDPSSNGDDGEAAIDVEVATAIAPSANIELASCPSGTVTFGGLIALQNLINTSGITPSVISVSYGVCEAANGAGGNAAFSTTYQQAAAQGFSVFVSSGDEGPSSCSSDFTTIGSEYDVTSLGVTGWGETPYNVSVGGTDFEDTYFSKTGGSPLSTYWSSSNSSTFGSALSYIPEIPWNDACASTLISEVAHGSFTPYGSSGTCNTSPFNTTAGYLSTGAASGGASNCATGAGGTNTSSYLISEPQCQGYAKPSYQSGAALSGGQAVYGQPSDGVRDIPDVSMFAANGVWGHFEVVCWSDPAYTSDGAAPCTGAPSTWSGFGGTSVASPTMAAIQALINQQTGTAWGNPNPYYYQIAQNEYGTSGGTFQGTSCNSSGSGGPGIGCAFNDVTQGDIDLACEDNGTTEEAHCYKPSGTYGVDSTDVITAATLINGGTGYTSAPTCTIAGPTNNSPYKSPTGTTLYAGGTQATCTTAVNSGSTTAKWTAKISNTTAVGMQIIVGTQAYTLSGTSASNIATNLAAAINANNTVATATSSTSTVTITAKATGYAGNFTVSFGNNGDLFQASYVVITNTILGQGPNYVSGITITGGGSGYQPETPVTLSGLGTGAIAIANTSTGTASSSYQPAYGAAPGYDMATGLGTPNAAYLVNSCSWYGGSPSVYSPASGSTLGSSSATFRWCIYPGATNYWLDVGSTAGGNNYYQSGSLPGATFAQSVASLPTDGSPVYVTWWYEVNGSWASTEYQYTASGGGNQLGVMQSPAPGSTLSGSNQLFTWTAGSIATAYEIDAGSTQGGNQYFQSGNVGNVTSDTVTGLPIDGSTVYITLWSLVNGQWVYNEYTYTAYNQGSSLGVITSPAPGSQFTGTTVTFQWMPGAGSSAYWLDIGSTAGGNQYYQSGNLGNVTQVTVNGLPSNGSTVYVTLYSLVGGQWVSNQYTYTAYSLSNGLAVMQSPPPGSEIDGPQATFTWTAGAGASGYWLDLGSTPGANDIYQSGNLGTQLSTTAYGLPNDGSEIYATLWTLVNGQWLFNSYQYQSGPSQSGPAGHHPQKLR